MAIRAYEGITKEWYTPTDEEGQEDAAEFELSPLTGPQLLDVQVHFDIENMTVLGPGLVLACKFGLCDWKNVLDGNGRDKKFNRLGYLKLPGDIIAELGGKIINISTLGEDDAKN